MYENFTASARSVLRLAEEEARLLNQPRVDEEHLLLGLIRERDGVAAKALSAVGVSFESVQAQAENLKGHRGRVLPEKLELTTTAHKVVNLFAKREAQRLGHDYIDTEHILLGLLRAAESPANKILAKIGVDERNILRQITDILSRMPPRPPVVTPTGPTKGDPHVLGQLESSASGAPLEFGPDLVQEIREGRTRPAVGREKEIQQIILVLARQSGNSPLLVGEQGVGKTATVVGLAAAIEAGGAGPFSTSSLYALDFDRMLRSVQSQRDLERRLRNIADKARQTGTLLFIDDLDEYLRPHPRPEKFELWPILRSLLEKGEIRIIGTVTGQAGKDLVLSNPALVSAMHVVPIDEPSADDTVEILKSLRERYQDHHGVIFTDDALTAVVEMAPRYSEHAFLPANAIDLFDDAGSYMRVLNSEGTGAPAIVDASVVAKVVSDRIPDPDPAPTPPHHPSLIDGDREIWPMV